MYLSHIPQIQLLNIASTADHKELQLLVHLLHHAREGEDLWVGSSSQLKVLVWEHIEDTMVLLICADLHWTIVVIVERLPEWSRWTRGVQMLVKGSQRPQENIHQGDKVHVITGGDRILVYTCTLYLSPRTLLPTGTCIYVVNTSHTLCT